MAADTTRYHWGMAMTLRPSTLQQAEIAAAAERAGVSMHQFILDAAVAAARGREQRRDDLLASLRVERRSVLDRLAE